MQKNRRLLQPIKVINSQAANEFGMTDIYTGVIELSGPHSPIYFFKKLFLRKFPKKDYIGFIISS